LSVPPTTGKVAVSGGGLGEKVAGAIGVGPLGASFPAAVGANVSEVEPPALIVAFGSAIAATSSVPNVFFLTLMPNFFFSAFFRTLANFALTPLIVRPSALTAFAAPRVKTTPFLPELLVSVEASENVARSSPMVTFFFLLLKTMSPECWTVPLALLGSA
jgi:hypothetical protein